MNKTLMSIVLLLSFAVLVGLSVASYAAESLGDVMDDTAITGTVKVELTKDFGLGTLIGIGVSTKQGVVTLVGKVHNFKERAMVEQKVRGVKHVVYVNNNLRVVSP